MNKTAIRNFAIWARKKLISDIKQKAAQIGITARGINEPLANSTHDMQLFNIGTGTPYALYSTAIDQRNSLVKRIKDKEENEGENYTTAYDSIMEEIAYTWFNRLIAIRFMEVNDFLPSGLRVLSSDSGKIEPDLVTMPFEADFHFSRNEEEIIRLKRENHINTVFRLLFIKQCNALNDILPYLFEKTSDYSELLLSISVTDQDGVVYHLVHDIPEADFNVEEGGQVEIIGWLYQYYNSEKKNAVFEALRHNVKISKENIPAATQLFTPDWIAYYMVENSLGRLWVEGHHDENLKKSWKYYLEEAEQEPDVQAQLADIRKGYAQLTPETISAMDPCVGSGHFACRFFDIFMQIYESCGYTKQDAVRSIIEKNISGLDIDKRAAQLAYFAVMMKARQYDRRFFSRKDEAGNLYIPQPHVYAICESNDVDAYALEYFVNGDAKLKEAMDSIIRDMHDAKEYGSILTVQPVDFAALYARFEEIEEEGSLYRNVALEMKPLVEVAEMLARQYDVVVTNPPYMSSSSMNKNLSDFVKKYYPDSKSDLFAVFIERCAQMARGNGYQAMITQHAWMFLSSFEKLRGKLLLKDTANMTHLGAHAFEEIGGEVVQTTTFVLRNSHICNYKGKYCRLLASTSQQGKEDMFLAGENRYVASQDNFSKIPGSPVAYWVSKNFIKAYDIGEKIGKFSVVSEGIKTGDNNKFLRLWFEVNKCEFSMAKSDTGFKWYPHHKGGEFRKWYGNRDWVINWENNGKEIKESGNSGLQGITMYFQPFISWSKISSKGNPFRFFDHNFLFDSGAPAVSNAKLILTLALFNTCVGRHYLSICPTINLQVGDVKGVPLIINKEDVINKIVQQNITISRTDWDSFETSWDFQRHPLVRPVSRMADAYAQWDQECNDRFNQLKANEEELNRIFIDIYGLQDELTPEEEDKDVTVRKADLERDVKSVISYAVGCMFGRYSLDVEGLAYAGGDWDSTKYTSFQPDADNIIPITDVDYFKDDIVGLFCNWLKQVYGEATLEENLTFIADALGTSGRTNREKIRKYFLKDFYKDHCQIYKKRPIYWLFDSGKKDGFKALIYMHRYTENTIGKVRADYLHRMEQVYEHEIVRMDHIIEQDDSSREVGKATKNKEKLQKQLKECRDYDEKIAHLAMDRIAIDLDDGVKVNYQKVQTDRTGKLYQILAKI